MVTWWACAGCGTAHKKYQIGVPQAPCTCGEMRYKQTSKEDALSNNPSVCDDHVSDDRLAELADEAEDLR